MSRPLFQKLEKFRLDLEAMHKLRQRERLQQARDLENGTLNITPLRTYVPSPDVALLFGDIERVLQADIARYAPPPMETDAAHATAVPPPPPQAVSGVAAMFTQEIRKQLYTWLGQSGVSLSGAHLPPGVAAFSRLLEEEISDLISSPAMQGSSGPGLVSKLKVVQQALQAQRYSDCVTLLKTVQRSDPHNPMVLFLLGQLHYFLTGQGQQGSLPEARDITQRSIIHSDKIPATKLWKYRYFALVSERQHDPERALAWLRDTGVLFPELLTDEWEDTGAAGVRGWAVLSTIPVKFWGEREFEALLELVQSVPCGALFYLRWFRQPLMEEAAQRKAAIPHLETVENLVQVAWTLYGLVATPLLKLTQTNREPTWVVRIRYMMQLARIVPPPGFDHVLLHIALDGRTWRRGYPDDEMRQIVQDSTASYWRLWCTNMTAERERRQSHILPAQETLDDFDLLTEADQMLEVLREAETSSIKADVWEDLQQWMPRWQLDHLLAAGSGSNQPRLRFAPTLPPYSSLYVMWSQPVPQHILSSDIIRENAMNGGFASLFEVQAAFEGAYRLLVDPVHGLIPSQRRALAAARRQNPAKFGGVNFDAQFSGSLVGLLIPVIVFGGVVILILNITANWGQAIGLIMALGGVTGILTVIMMMRPKK